MMKTMAPLLVFITLGFTNCLGQYEPVTPRDETEKDYTKVEIRRFLLTQEKGSPVWELARASQVSIRWGSITAIVGVACLIGGYVGYSTMSHEGLLSYMEEGFYQVMMAAGALNLGISVWQFRRADRKLEQAKKLYY